MTLGETLKQVQDLTVKLVELGLCDQQNFPATNKAPDGTQFLTISGAPNLTIAMKNIEYREIYIALLKTNSFNFKMLDGGLIQLLYTFSGPTLVKHRLAYFPSPDFETFQNEPELYLEDGIYADILQKNVTAFPIRFDFDASDHKHIDIAHPKSHLTLGQYQNCRIPVLAPLSPVVFIKFLLQHFYNTAFRIHDLGSDLPLTYFPNCITSNEQNTPHLSFSKL